MKDEGEVERERRFADEWRAWLERPLRRSPQAAAARVSAMLKSRRRGSRPVWAIAAAASFVLVAAVILFVPREVPRQARTNPGAPAPAADLLRPGEVLIWLDADTPLYMHFQSPGGEGVN